jgi:hypothetical protein
MSAHQQRKCRPHSIFYLLDQLVVTGISVDFCDPEFSFHVHKTHPFVKPVNGYEDLAEIIIVVSMCSEISDLALSEY